jgi:endonuclease/exonuclease/phosphatase family metal-dependent hydrolase
VRSLLLLPLLALAACRHVEHSADVDAPPAGTHLRVATFNVRRFFDTVCDSGACESGDYEAQATQASFDQRAAQIAAAITRLDADVVALEEIEDQTCLDALLSHLPTMHGVLGETDFAASVDVAIVSRAPIERVVRHRAATPLTLDDGRTTTFSRELLEVHVQIDGHPVIVLAAHFKSKSDDDPLRRLAEARASSRIVNDAAAAEPAAIVMLAGDLNDVPGSPPLDALTVDGGLMRVADDLAPAAQATYYFNGSGQAIDHILLVPTTNVMRVPRSSRTWRDTGSNGFGGSDHAALSSDFQLPL